MNIMKIGMCILVVGIFGIAYSLIRENISQEMSYTDKGLFNTEMLNTAPYALFGNEEFVLMTRCEREKEHSLNIENHGEQGIFAKLELNFQTGLIQLLNHEGKVMSSRKLELNEKARWFAIDPLAEDYNSTSPYAYCLNNPMKYIDPDGESTWVVPGADGTYRVVGGNLNDGSCNIYVINGMEDILNLFGMGRTQTVLGETMTMTSFYKSESDKWMGTISLEDRSGLDFLNDFMKNEPGLIKYMLNAYGGRMYDFKKLGYDENLYKQDVYFYRGMQVGMRGNGMAVYSSARDVGNFAAGYIAGVNRLTWREARLGFDALESWQQGGLSREGISSQNAQYLGWQYGKKVVNRKNQLK